MQDIRSVEYAQKMSELIKKETVSVFNGTDKTKFYEFQEILKQMFPDLFRVCEFEDFNGSFLLKQKGTSNKEPVMFMNHFDVVEATGEWKYGAFSGAVEEGKLWGRGTLDTKGGLYCMLQAAEELVKEGFVPERDFYFESACTEETDGSGADIISETLKKRGLHFYMVLDEGGMILYDPIGGADGTFAMVGVGEKGYADIKFTAKSSGGHASTPSKNTPLVRLGKFMADIEKSQIFPAKMSDVICEMFSRMSPSMHGAMKGVLSNPKSIKHLLAMVLPSFSDTANALLRTTLAFTMANGSEGTNVLPAEAYVVGNMRYSHHQGKKASIKAVTEFAKKYGIETEVLDAGIESYISDFNSEPFKLIEKAVGKIFSGVETAPYIMTGASDSRYMNRICDNCLRFTPFVIDDEQMKSIHGINENIDVSCLAPAVDFYKFIMRNL